LKPVILHPEAQREFEESGDFYEREAGRPLALRFVRHVRATFTAIARNPERWRRVVEFPLVQKCRVARFPFFVYDVNRDAAIYVVAVAHDKRRPEYWAGRLE